MIDMHSHILPNVDDGSRTPEETFNLIKEAHNAGFTTIVSTSHYYLGRYEPEELQRRAYIDAISEKLKDIIPDMKICIGSEIFVTHRMVDLLKEHKASSINGTRYVLFELPFEEQIPNLKDIIYNLLSNKYIPIIAHPERYKYVQKDPNLLLDLIDLGVLFQGNYGSILGQYGKEARKTLKLLLENNFIHFLGSDAHRENTIYLKIQQVVQEFEKIMPKERIEELTTLNPKAVLANETIDIRRPTKIKKGIFGF